jgi:hypothetical protein
VEEKDRVALIVREHATEGFFLEGSRLVSCSTINEAVKVLNHAMKHRRIGSHELNNRSNRSHCITDIFIDVDKKPVDSETAEDKNDGDDDNDDDLSKGERLERKMEKQLAQLTSKNNKYHGKISLIDLAGSERLKNTNSTGKVLLEAGFINRFIILL